MTKINESQIKSRLNEIIFSDSSTMLSRASNIIQNKNDIGFSVDITSLDLKQAEDKRLEAIGILSQISGIGKISIVLTSSKKESTEERSGGRDKIHIEGVKYVLAVAAGKGGVGKSTVSALIAERLTLSGKKVGIVDADIYGPSIPQIFGLQGKPVINDKKMIPLIARGIEVNSIGFLTAPNSSISWRGPMVSKALYQLLSLTRWGDLDCLIIDLPPGTGDIHLSLLQNYILDSVIMVTTPQKISKIDVCRAIDLYKKFSVSILGIIENMSYLTDPVTGQPKTLFSGNAGEEIANSYKLPLLAKLPIEPDLADSCDRGESLIKYADLMNKVAKAIV
jgi:ATP-binding protein involved in chromosome partitioning